MKRDIARILLACLLTSCTAGPHAQPLKAWGYAVPWLPQGWQGLPLQELERVVIFGLEANGKGELTGEAEERWAPLHAALAASATPYEVAVTCTDPAAFLALFSDAQSVNTLLEQTLALARQPGVAGIHLDFEVYEAVPPAPMLAYLGYVRALASRLHGMATPRELSIFFPIDTETAMYDRDTLALTDQVVLQGYDMHWLRSEFAGPVSTLKGMETWEDAIDAALRAGASRDRLLMGFPLYGYEWPVHADTPQAKTAGEGRALYYAQPHAAHAGQDEASIQDRVRHFGVVHDAQSGSAYYQFQRGGQRYEGWFEDGLSLSDKSRFLRERGLRGMAFFALGYDKGELVRHFLREQRNERDQGSKVAW